LVEAGKKILARRITTKPAKDVESASDEVAGLLPKKVGCLRHSPGWVSYQCKLEATEANFPLS
jgi:hypothetical protein